MTIRRESIAYVVLAGCTFCLGYLIAPETIETEPEVHYVYSQANKNEMQNLIAMQYSNKLIKKSLKINKNESIKNMLESCSEVLEKQLKEYDLIDKKKE